MPKVKMGAPVIYDEERIKLEADLLLEWLEKEDSIFFKTFCIERGYGAQRLTEFAEKSKYFSEVYEYAKDWQECRLINLGLWNKTNAGLTKFMLVNKHGYKENPVNIITATAASIPPEATDTSRDLVHESN